MAKPGSFQIRRNPTLWTILLLALLLVIINFIGWIFYIQVREILDDELSRRLQSLASISTLLIDDTKVSELSTNSNSTSARFYLFMEMEEIKNVTSVGNLYVLDTDREILIQTDTTFTERHPTYFDQQEIDSAFHGNATASFPYYIGNNYYKRGYAPIKDSRGNIVAVLGVEANADSFRPLRRIRNALQFMGAISLVLIIATIIILNRVFAFVLRLEERVLAADKFQSLAQLSAGVAHEVRNPLGIISGNAELLKEEIKDDKNKQELVQNIVSETERLDRILRNFLEFSKPGSLVLRNQDINEILEKTLQLCQHQLQKEGVIITKQFEKDLPKVKFDSQRLIQVFLNLILNAKDALLQGGWLTVRTLTKDNSVIVEIQDSGMGIEHENLAKIFDPFYTTKKTGSGLGLSIAKRIIEDHGGTLKINSEKGKGTTARVILPSL